jgi:hypothetical protein
MRGRLGILIVTTAALAALGCESSTVYDDDLCAEVDCSGHGTCAVAGGDTAVCLCDAGYHAEGTTCVANVVGDECRGVDCNTGGVCAVSGGAPICVCGPGFHALGPTTCMPDDTPDDPCDGVTCSGHGTCAVVGGDTAICACEAGYQPHGSLECSAVGDPCATVDCLEHGTCAVVDGRPACTCEAGYHLWPGRATRCVPDAKTVSFVAPSREVLEDADVVVLPIRLSEPLPPDADLDVGITVSGTATSGTDYTALPASIRVSRYLHTGEIRVTVTDDTATEAAETVVVTLTAPSGWALGPHPTFTLTILDDESADYGPDLCVQWGVDGDDSAGALVVDSRDRVFVGGKTDGDLYGPQQYEPPGGLGDVVLASYDTAGAFQWGLQYGSIERDGIRLLATDATEEHLYTLAVFDGGNELRKLRVSDQSEVWRNTWQASYSPILSNVAQRMLVAPSGNVVLAGGTNRGFDGQVHAGGLDGYVTSWAPGGDAHWTRFFGGFATESVGGLALDAAGNIYACGSVVGSLDGQPYGAGICNEFSRTGFGPVGPNPDASPCRDAFLVKYSPTGTKLWTRQWGHDDDDGCTGLAVSSAGVVLAFGFADGADSPALTRFDAAGNLLSLRKDWMYGTQHFFLDDDDNTLFGSPSELVTFDPAGETLVSIRHFLTPGRYLGVGTFVLESDGRLFVAGAADNYCEAPAPPGTGNNAFWARFDP